MINLSRGFGKSLSRYDPRMTAPLAPADLFSLRGRVVVVTGASGGLGERFARVAHNAGAHVVGAARRVERLKALESQLSGFRGVETDVTDSGSLARLVDDTVDEFGRIDVLVNNAGGGPPADTTTSPPRFTERVIALNLFAAIFCSQRANHWMQEADGGSIVNVSSVSGIRPSPMSAAYGAAKAGLVNFTMTAAMEWAPKVRVNAVTVGLMLTEQAHLFYGDDEGIARVSATVPLGRMAVPTDVGDICLFLASPLAAYVTGANLVAHGGGERPPFLDAATS